MIPRLLLLLLVPGLTGPQEMARAGEAKSLPGHLWPGADLFTNGAVEQLKLEIAETNVAKLTADPRGFVRATAREPGAVYADVAVHLKGEVGSFRPITDKPAFTLDFDRFNRGARYHGLRRIHLNNSVEDPSYANEHLGSQIFLAAGVPTPRAGHAVVWLNGRRLGLYALKEGFTEDFLACHFKPVGGNLYEPGEGHDVNEVLKRIAVQAPRQKSTALETLAKAALDADPDRRWQRLQQALDVDEFIRFTALEVMLGHRDGYSLARNNFRVYENPDTGKIVFFPHGMDQLFGSPDLPWQPQMAGLVARAVLDTPQGNQRYRETFTNLFFTVFDEKAISQTLTELPDQVRPCLSTAELTSLKAELGRLHDRIAARRRYLAGQISRPPLELLRFTNGVGRLDGWAVAEQPGSGAMGLAQSPDGVIALHISARTDSAASWRSRALLDPGRYRFEGRVRVNGVKPLSYGQRHGAGLRIAGRSDATAGLVGNSSWQTLSTEFAVQDPSSIVEFVCELRAQAGEAWFDAASLSLVKLTK